MNCRQAEPTLTDALADPVVRAMMAADGVDPQALEITLRNLARQVMPAPHHVLPEFAETLAQC
jgi:hypothetical protein